MNILADLNETPNSPNIEPTPSEDMDHEDVNEILNDIRIKNINNIIIAYLNINSFPNKYDALNFFIPENIDIMIIGETKLDDSYPTTQFLIDGFSKPFRRDRDKFGGGTLCYVRKGLLCMELTKHTFPDDIEGLIIEINLRKSKWLLLSTYHPQAKMTPIISIL